MYCIFKKKSFRPTQNKKQIVNAKDFYRTSQLRVIGSLLHHHCRGSRDPCTFHHLSLAYSHTADAEGLVRHLKNSFEPAA